MQETNSYGDISGGYIFDMMDREAHKDAIEQIGDCLTASANINYFMPLNKSDKFTIDLRSY